jgi:IMP and pyridine-specific 5'-nucleotidase
MSTWTQPTITNLLDLAESSLRECVTNLSLEATILRKERAVGIIPSVAGYHFPRESLEETVLVVQKKLEMNDVGNTLPFCAFNGGNDVFVDIGDKSWGVLVCQNYFGSTPSETGKGVEGGSIRGDRTLHVGDQFLSAGSNSETVELLDELAHLIDLQKTIGGSGSDGMEKDLVDRVDKLFEKHPMPSG